MATPLRPQSIGPLPDGITPRMRMFLQSVKDALEILIGDKTAQTDSGTPAGSKAVTFSELSGTSGTTTGTGETGTYSKTFMHMGAL